MASGPENDLNLMRRGGTAALSGLAVQALLAVGALALMVFGRVSPLPAVFWNAVAGLQVWAALVIIYELRKAKVQEDLELEAARRTGETATSIFASDADARPANRRLDRARRYLLPAVSVLVALVLIATAVLGLRAEVNLLRGGASDLRGLSNLGVLTAVAFGLAFIGFIVGRYLLGMAQRPEWRLLHAGGVFVLGTTFLLVIAGIAGAAAAVLDTNVPARIAAYVAPLINILIGVELLLNLVLDLYRPRRTGEEVRPAFDSRLLALVGSPGGVVKSLNEAVNYQFGFEITRSWFYRLVARSFVWLVLFGVGLLVLLSSVVVVEPHQRAIVTTFGALEGEPRGPGIHFKWPWPVGGVDKLDVTRVRLLSVGSHNHITSNTPILWGNAHAEGEEMLMIVAPPRDARRGGSAYNPVDVFENPADAQVTEAPEGAAVPDSAVVSPAEVAEQQPNDSQAGGAATGTVPSINLAAAEVFVQWRIDPDKVLAYVTSHEDPEARLREIANAAAARRLLQNDIDELIGPARDEAAADIAETIRAEVERENLGINVAWVGVAGIHPPQSVAEAFHETVGAQQERETSIEQGLLEATQILAASAGSRAQAEEIMRAYHKLQQLRRDNAPADEIAQQELAVERLVEQAGGSAAVSLANARAFRWTHENQARGDVARFPADLAAYERAPTYFTTRRWLDVLGDAMTDKEKLLLLTDKQDLIIRYDNTKSAESVFNDLGINTN